MAWRARSVGGSQGLLLEGRGVEATPARWAGVGVPSCEEGGVGGGREGEIGGGVARAVSGGGQGLLGEGRGVGATPARWASLGVPSGEEGGVGGGRGGESAAAELWGRAEDEDDR